MSLWMAIARVLGLLFSLILARIFSPSEFGVIQYAITLAGIVAVGTEPFGMHVIARFIASQKGNTDQIGRSLTNLSLLQFVVFGISLLIAVPVILWLAPSNILGILIIFLGQTVFYSYWGLARGLQAPNRLAAAYLGSNVVQLVVVFFLIQVVGVHSLELALVIYGSSYFLPLALLQYFWPLTSSGLNKSLVDRAYISNILKFSSPIWLSQISYILFVSIDILLIEQFLGSESVGVYRLTKTIASVLSFLPLGIGFNMLADVASSPKHTHAQLLKRSLTLTLTANAVILVFYLLLLQPFIKTFFGSAYLTDMLTAIVLACGIIVRGVNGIIATFWVGRGRPEIETISRFVGLTITTSIGFVIIPRNGIAGAAIAVMIGEISCFCTLLLFGLVSDLKSRQIQN